MIRILIREVTDHRYRAPKSLGLADIEPAADLPLYPGERARDYSVRIYHGSPYDGQVRFQTRVPSPGFQLSAFQLFLLGLASFGQAQIAACSRFKVQGSGWLASAVSVWQCLSCINSQI